MDSKNPRQGELARAASFDRECQPSSSETRENSTTFDHQVILGQGIGNMFLVSVEPPHPDHPPQIFDCHRKARGYAGGLRMCHRWQIVDQTGDGK